MSWIKRFLKKRIEVIIYLMICLVFFNPHILSILDPNPPLSKTALISIFVLHVVNIIGIVLFIWKRNIFFQFLVAGVFIIIIDLAIAPFIDKPNHKEFRLQQPEPYINADYYSSEFVEEAFVQPQRWIFDRANGGIKPNNFNGQWFNVRDHRRVTVNADALFLNKLYLFGGSTIYSSEVPDSLTIASLLASVGANDASFEVINMGATSIHSAQQFARLRSEIELREGDIVIFYDGVNDVQQRIVYENQQGYMYGAPKNENFFVKVIRYAEGFSSIARLLLDTMANNIKSVSNELVDESINNYIETLRTVNNYVISHDARFFHFLQPTLFTKSNLNNYERSLLEMGNPFVPKQSKVVFELAYPIISERLLSEGYSASLVDAFDHLETSPYLDFCHVNHIGNQVIASRIWDLIGSRL